MSAGPVLCASIAILLAGCAAAPFQPDAGQELKAARDAAGRTAIPGPAEVALADRTVLELDEGFAFVPPAEGLRLLRALGRSAQANLLGVVVAGRPEGAEVAALYARGVDPAIPEIMLDGWRSAPALAGFRRKK